MFRPGGLCQLLTEFCKQLTKTKTSESKRPAFTSPVCKPAVLLITFHVERGDMFRGLCQLLTEFCKQLTKTSGSKRPALTSPCVKLQYCSLCFMLKEETGSETECSSYLAVSKGVT